MDLGAFLHRDAGYLLVLERAGASGCTVHQVVQALLAAGLESGNGRGVYERHAKRIGENLVRRTGYAEVAGTVVVPYEDRQRAPAVYRLTSLGLEEAAVVRRGIQGLLNADPLQHGPLSRRLRLFRKRALQVERLRKKNTPQLQGGAP